MAYALAWAACDPKRTSVAKFEFGSGKARSSAGTELTFLVVESLLTARGKRHDKAPEGAANKVP